MGIFNQNEFIHTLHIIDAGENLQVKCNLLKDLDHGVEIISAIADSEGFVHYVIRKEVKK